MIETANDLTTIEATTTPQQYNKKPVEINRGLDFLRVWRGKSKKAIGKTIQKLQESKISGSKFLI